jgi:hypothetical protein
MSEDIREIRQKIDLHHGRKDFSSNRNYVEFSFHVSFSELFNIDPPWEIELTGNEIISVLNRLQIKFDKELLVKKYLDASNHSVEVFHSIYDEQIFVYFDMLKDPTDQIDMFYIGISCLKADEKEIHEILLNIYRVLKTHSLFTFGIGTYILYNKVFRSYFYFYENNYNEYKRKMYHHNLKSPYLSWEDRKNNIQ